MHAGQATLVPVRGAWCRRRVADVQDLQAALRFERLDGVVLVGHSCGGMVMTQVADRTPERIRALVYVDAMLGAVIHPAADDGNPDVPLSWGECELAMVSSLFTREPVAADVVVAQDATFLWLPVTALEDSLLRSRDLLVLLMTYQSRRLREVQLREQVWLERNVHHRLCPRLARISFGLPENDDGHMVLDATCETLAARCGVSRPRMPKEPKPLEEVGRVKLGRGSVEIVDRAWFDQACR